MRDLPRDGKIRAIALLAIAQVLALSLWFSGTAAMPGLRAAFVLTDLGATILTSAVQAGFILGTLVSALLGLADRIDPRLFFRLSAIVAALANAALLLPWPEPALAFAARLVTGMCMAGIYPVGMKLAASWADRDLGLLVGLLVGALTLGSALPHLFIALLGGLDWRLVIALASAAALAAALLIGGVAPGPKLGAAPRFDPAAAFRGFRDPALRLANLGYFGHMWELYALWAWIAVFLQASFSSSMPEPAALQWARYGGFVTIAAGAAGCLAAGYYADRIGRTAVTALALAVSGACCLLSALLFGAAPWLMILLCIIWGIAVVADSAQFSASVTELAEKSLIGTMLTVQVCVGFALTLVTIHLVPVWAEMAGWRSALAPLCIGPAVGIWAMLRLRRRPEAAKLAGGRR